MEKHKAGEVGIGHPLLDPPLRATGQCCALQDLSAARWLTGSAELLSGLLFSLPVLLFSHVESFFTFTTLSAVGFGDYVIIERLGAGRVGTQLSAPSRPWHSPEVSGWYPRRVTW